MGVTTIESGKEIAREAVKGELEKLSRQYGLNIEEIIGIAQNISSKNEREGIKKKVEKEQDEINRDPVLKTLYNKMLDLESIRVSAGQRWGGYEAKLDPESIEERNNTINYYCKKNNIKVPNTREEGEKFFQNIIIERKISSNLFNLLKNNPELGNLLKNGSQVKVQRSNGQIESGWEVAIFNGINVIAINKEKGIQKIIPAGEILTINSTNN